MQQHRLSVANLQVRQSGGSVEGATVQELASWVTAGSIRAMEVHPVSIHKSQPLTGMPTTAGG